MDKNFNFKPGMKVILKTKQQLLADGWEYNEESYMLEKTGDSDGVTEEMFEFLGTTVTVDEVFDDNSFVIKEDDGIWSYNGLMVDAIDGGDISKICLNL